MGEIYSLLDDIPLIIVHEIETPIEHKSFPDKEQDNFDAKPLHKTKEEIFTVEKSIHTVHY